MENLSIFVNTKIQKDFLITKNALKQIYEWNKKLVKESKQKTEEKFKKEAV